MDWPPPLRPRRESIEDHLATARARFPELRATEAVDTRSFVRSLIRRGFIKTPCPVKKSHGPGQGARFLPRDYRALIEILRLRANGHGHASRWTVWLWLRGRDFSNADIRAALEQEAKATFNIVGKQLNPSGRATRPFHESYERNVAPTRGDSPFPDLGGLDEPLARMLMRPNEKPAAPIDLDEIAATVAAILGTDEKAMAAAIHGVASDPNLGFGETAERLADALPNGPMNKMLRAMATMGDQPAFPQVVGMLDGSRGDPAIIKALTNATDEQLKRAREEIQRLRTGQLDRELDDLAAAHPGADEDILAFARGYARMERWTHRGNPAFAAYLVAVYIHADGDPIPLNTKGAVDANALLKTLRAQAQQPRDGL